MQVWGGQALTALEQEGAVWCIYHDTCVCCCRKVKCVFAKDEKVSQLKRGTRHNCRIDETIQLEVTGDKESGEPLTCPSKPC